MNVGPVTVLRPHRGIPDFYRRAAEAGADSIFVDDVPLAEADPFLAEAARRGIAPVMIAPPTPRCGDSSGLPGLPKVIPT